MPIPQPDGAAEYQEAILSCMRDRGWEGSIAGDAIQYAPVPLEQGSKFEADNSDCVEVAQEYAPTSAPLSDALLALNYDRTQAAYDCYVKNGFPIEDLPSYQQWRDRLDTDPYAVASTIRQMQGSGGVSVAAAQAKCVDPDAFFFDVVTRIYEDQVDYEAYAEGAG